MYDFLLGGKDNYESDRQAVAQLLTIEPGIKDAVETNRAFLGRVVRHLVKAGYTQFLDIGSGLPTRQNVHQVAHAINPDVQVVYVDNDPIVLVHGRALLVAGDNVAMVPGDIRDVDAILADPEVRAHLDFDKPIAVLNVAILHFIPDSDDPGAIVAKLRDNLPPGSALALTHACADDMDPADAEAATAVYAKSSAPIMPRSRAEIARLLEGWELDGELVDVAEWQPDDDGLKLAPSRTARFIGGIAYLPRS